MAVDMLNLIKDFPAQILKGLEIGASAPLKEANNQIFQNIVIAGQGGSGIGGNILAEILRPELNIPIIVSKGYSLPGFVDESTLLILCSNSGDTEEIIQCAGYALAQGLRPVCITSGGQLESLALTNGLDMIKLPGGFPPRACLAYAVIQLFFVLKGYGIISGNFEHSFKQTAALLSSKQEQIIAETKALASGLAGKILVAYTEDKYESTVLRFKQQINENSKMHCWYNVLPELNHNELVGWKNPPHNLAVIIFRAADENNRNSYRLEFTKDVIGLSSTPKIEVTAQGQTAYEKRFYLIHWGDWLSYHLAVAQGIDAMEVNVLNKLKTQLQGVN